MQVAAGYNVLEFERQLRGMPARGQANFPASAMNSPTEPMSTKPAGELEDFKVTEKLVQPVIIDLVSDESDTEVSQGAQHPAAVVDSTLTNSVGLDEVDTLPFDPVSPALSYLTIDDPPHDDGAPTSPEELRPAEQKNRQLTLTPQSSRQLSLASYDSDSSDERDHMENSPSLASEFEGAHAHLLCEDLAAVKRHIRGASSDQRRYFQLLSAHDKSIHSKFVDQSVEASAEGYASQGDSSPDEEHSSSRRSSTSSQTLASSGIERKPASSRRKRKETGLVPHFPRPLSTTVDGAPRTAAVSKSVSVPKAPLTKARRALVPGDTSFPIVTVSMRFDVQFIDQTKR